MVNTKFKMRIDLNVLNHLGLNLYSNVPAVLSEVVANCWDADAKNVDIDINPKDKVIVIEDDGIGMTQSDINEKYLTVGYAKRTGGKDETEILGRPVMGRKGIGKLSLFSIANIIDVYSTKDGELNAFRLDAGKIKEAINRNDYEPYYPEELPIDGVELKSGTRLILSQIKRQRLTSVDTHLRKRLSRRFSVLGEKHMFNVNLNQKPITVADRDYFHKIEYLWYYGDESLEYRDYSNNAVQKEKRNNTLNGGHKITGWLGLVKESGHLQDGDDNLNKIVLLMRGKMAKEDLLEEFREGGLFTKYLFGELTADFLDYTNLPDIATSSRQNIFEDDDRYKVLQEFLKSELKHISNKRAQYKASDVEAEILKIESINSWYSSLGRDTKNKAKKFFGRINQIITDPEHKRHMYTHGVLAFESFRYKDSLDSLNSISIENLDEFLKVFKELEEIESTLFYQITKERLAIIEKLKEHVHDENALEKILQAHIFESLWLLDPSWDRATSTPYMEERVESEFGKIDACLTEEEKKGRLDIKYKTPAGKHVIVELKRASVKTSTYALQEQVDKYRSGLGKILREIDPSKEPVIDAVCIVGKHLKDWDTPKKQDESVKSMAAKNTRVVTYQQLINDAYNAYKTYLDKNKESGELIKIINNIDQELQESKE